MFITDVNSVMVKTLKLSRNMVTFGNALAMTVISDS